MPRVSFYRYGVQYGKWSIEWVRGRISLSREISPEEARKKHGVIIHKAGTPDDMRYLLAVLHYLRANADRTATLVEDGPWTIAPPAAHAPITFESIRRTLRTMCEGSPPPRKPHEDSGRFVLRTSSPHDSGDTDNNLIQATFTPGPPRGITIELVEIG